MFLGDLLILCSGLLRRLGPALGMACLLAACGQKGPLMLPTGEAAAGRATVIQTLTPDALRPAAGTAAGAPVPGASSPQRTP